MPATLTSTLETVRDLYRQGLYVQAYEESKEHGPLKEWTASSARVLAGRLAYNLGSARLGRVLHLLALRADPTDPEAIYYGATAILSARGLLSAWEFIERTGELPEAAADIRCDWFALKGNVAAQMRDFDTAHAWLLRAEEIAPERPYLWIERAWVLKEEDRYEEALEAAQHSMDLSPWYRPGVQTVAHLLELEGRDDDALELLSRAAACLESCSVVAQLAELHCELGNHQQSREAWARFAELAPLLEERGRRWLAGRRCDAAYRCGDYREAAEWARQADETLQKMAERIAASEAGERKILAVGFIRQHHLTCAPATLSALSRFWSMPVDHIELADKICYDGTPHHSQREWAQSHGWTVREFTVTWDNCRALIDRGVPFTLTTVDPGNAHLQAVIGYDTRRGTIIIRDPTSRHYLELLAKETLERYASTGPRGMALVPEAKSALLDGIDLTDAALYDHHHRLQGALEANDRNTAHEACEALARNHSDHLLTLFARLSLSDYDADPTARLEAAEALLERFPDDANLQMSKLTCLRELSRRDERLAYLQGIFESPQSDPLLWQQYAQELAEEPRQHDRAARLIRRCIRCRPHDGNLFFALGNILWNRRELDKALLLFRIAACKEERNEQLAQVYFSAARFLERTPEVLSWLGDRFERFGKKSGFPGQTLFWAYSVLDKMDEAFSALEEALKRRPEDRDLALYAADAYARYGERQRGNKLLEAARGQSRQSTWLRTAAALEVYEGNLAQALGLWREVVEREPLAIDAHRALARLLEAVESRAAARQHLEVAAARFPHNYPLHQLLIDFLEEEDPEEAEPVIRRLIAIHPVDGWARRELALNLCRLNRLDEAIEAADRGIELEPYNPFSHYIRGWLAALADQRTRATRCYRRAVELSVDCDGAIRDLIHNCESIEERREALTFVQQQLVEQVTLGDGLLTFRRLAADTLPPGELLSWLENTLEARPDLWHAWSATVQQLLHMGQAERALEVARQATARFSLLPRLWVDLARCHLQMRDFALEKKTLERALQIDPNCGEAVRQLASAYERDGDFPASRHLLEQAVARTPLDPQIHGYLADVLWKLDEDELALDHMERALVIDPGYRWGWDTLLGWAQELHEPDIAVRSARDLTERRPGEARSWLVLAQMLRGSEELLEEALTALDKAIELSPRSVDAYDVRAELLAQAGRFEEAFQTCDPEVFRARPQIRLRGRAAWVHAVAGNPAEAVAQLENVVEEDPSFYDGWQLLADWYDQADDDVAYERAVAQLVRLAPHDVIARGYLADAKRRNGLRHEAKEEFRRALDVAPGYVFGARSLFDLYMEDGEIDEAEHVVEILRAHVDDPEVLVFELRLAVHQIDRPRLTRTLSELCLDPSTNHRTLDGAAEVLVDAGLASDLEAGLLAAMKNAAANPVAGTVWVERFAAERGRDIAEQHLEEWQQHGDLAAPALRSYIEHLWKKGDGEGLERLIKRDRAACFEDDETWATIGYAYLHLNDAEKGLRWLADWKERGNIGSAVLTYRALAAEKLDPEELLDSLEDALREHPDLWQVWSAVIRQLLYAGRTGEALEKAAEATERLPQVPRLWLDLSICHLEAREFDKERDALERAVQIDPYYGDALRHLASAYERLGDFDASRRLLEGAVARTSGEAQLHGFLADVLWKLGERDEAVRQMETAVAIDPGYRWAWQTLIAWTRDGGGDPDRVVRLARELTERSPDEARSWLVLAQVLRETEDAPDGAVAALDRAIEIDPRSIDAHDARAELLVEAGRFDEALAACRPRVRNLPRTRLRGRAAWVVAASGNLAEAIRQLSDVLEEDPSYYEGWQLLANWHDATGDDAAYEQAVERLVALAPQDATARGYLAHAKLRNNSRHAAKEEFRRALDLAPEYLFAGRNLFELELEDGEIDAAERTLELLKAHVGDAEVLVLEMRLAAHENARPRVAETLRQLCLSSSADASSLENAAAIAIEAGLPDDLEAALLEAMEDPGANPYAGVLWVQQFARKRGWDATEKRLAEWRRHGDRAAAAVTRYIDILEEDGAEKRLDRFIVRDRAGLFGDDVTWAAVGRAYVNLHKHTKAVRWLADWRQRKNITPHVLLSVVRALRQSGRDADAADVSHRAVRLPPDHASFAHNLWVAAECALARRTEAAASHLSRAAPLPDSAYYRFIEVTVHAVVAVQAGREGLLDATNRLRAARAIFPSFRQDGPLRRLYRAVLRRIAADSGKVYGFAWRLILFVRS